LPAARTESKEFKEFQEQAWAGVNAIHEILKLHPTTDWTDALTDWESLKLRVRNIVDQLLECRDFNAAIELLRVDNPSSIAVLIIATESNASQVIGALECAYTRTTRVHSEQPCVPFCCFLRELCDIPTLRR